MKKTIALLLALVMCFALCACGGNGKVKLTAENYSTYISLNPYIATKGNRYSISEGVEIPDSNSTQLLFSDVYFTGVKARGLSDNFIYEDITIEVLVKGQIGTVSFTGTDRTIVWEDVEEVLTLPVDISGNGYVHGTEVNTYARGERVTCSELSRNVSFEIVSISGKVSKA